VATVNGLPIDRDEYALFVRKHRALASGEQLKREALQDAVAWKVLQSWAKQEGLTPYTDYASLREELRRFNRQREKALRNGEVVFGPDRYDEWSFVDRKRGEWSSALQDIIASRADFPESRIRDYYEANKEQFVSSVTIRAKVGFVPKADDRDGEERAMRLLKEARDAVAGGSAWEEATAPLKSQGGIGGFRKEERQFDEHSAMGDRLRPVLLRQARSLAAGEISEPFRETDGYYVIQVIEKTSPGAASFEEMKERISLLLAQEDFELELERRVREAAVVADASAHRPRVRRPLPHRHGEGRRSPAISVFSFPAGGRPDEWEVVDRWLVSPWASDSPLL
jgi:hypothetical protein